MKGYIMKIFSFMRKPLKPMLYGMLLALLCTVALIFALQYQTDKQTLRDWLDNYTYIGTICPDVEGNAMLTPIPEDAKALLKDADTIHSLHSIQTYAARLTDGYLVPDHMMTISQLYQRYFIQAKVTGSMGWGDMGIFKCDRYAIELVKEWGSDKTGDRGLHLNVWRLANEPVWESGQELFFTSSYTFDHYNLVNMTEFEFYTPAAWEAMMGVPPMDIFTQNPVLLLEEGEGEEEILAFLEETGMMPYYEKFTQLDGNLAVRTISDFYALPKTANDRIYITDGRAITKEDAGKKVCMISQNLMNRNRYALGDIVTLEVAEESYSLYGWENGNPMPEDELLTSYGEPQEYEIVGIYNQIGRNAYDPLYYSHTDIFIPVGEEIVEFTLPYAFSFKVQGVDYDTFLAETLPVLEGYGCVVTLADTGWEDVEDAYYAMEVRCKVMLFCAALAFVAAAAVFTVLLYWHLRKEYGLQRLMGAYRHEACQVYLAALVAIAIPALAVSGIAGYLIVKGFMQSIVVGNALLFVLLPMALFVTVCLLLLLLVTISERGSLRKIIM